MNLQELQTILSNAYPVKIFMYNNNGYLSIKLTQNAFFSGHYVGSTPESGVHLPDMRKLAEAYGFRTYLLRNNAEAEARLPAQKHLPRVCPTAASFRVRLKTLRRSCRVKSSKRT